VWRRAAPISRRSIGAIRRTPPIVLIKPRPFIHGSSLFVRMSTSALARTCATIKTRSLQDA